MNVRASLLAVICALLPGCVSRLAPVPTVTPSVDAASATADTAPVAPAAPPPAQSATAGPVDFNLMVRPILEANCSPCHFEGGKMYESLPFDQAETIRTLGEALFTRIRDEGERAVIRGFLVRAGAEAAPATSP
jgi:hypothetical protein